MFRLTLFNGITLFVLALTVLMAAARARGRLKTNWAIPFYLVLAGYAFGFDGSLNRWWLLAGAVCAAVLRLDLARGTGLLVVRAAEFVFFGYVLLRGVQLVLMWPW